MDLLGRLSNRPPTPVGQEEPGGPGQPRKAVGSDRRVRKRRVPRRLNQEEVELLVSRYRAGEPIAVLTLDFGIPKQTLFDHIKRAGVPKRYESSRWTDAQLREAKRLYLDGSSLAAIGYHFDLGSTTVWNRLRAADVVLRPRRGWFPNQ